MWSIEVKWLMGVWLSFFYSLWNFFDSTKKSTFFLPLSISYTLWFDLTYNLTLSSASFSTIFLLFIITPVIIMRIIISLKRSIAFATPTASVSVILLISIFHHFVHTSTELISTKLDQLWKSQSEDAATSSSSRLLGASHPSCNLLSLLLWMISNNLFHLKRGKK